MKHYSHRAFDHNRSQMNVEFGSEFGLQDQHLDHEAKKAFLSAKAGGTITKRLVEIGEQMLMDQPKK